MTQQAAISNTLGLLREWDKGSKPVRRQILLDFIEQNQNRTGPEIDDQMAQAASLFLARLSAWLRISYLEGTHLTEQLQAISVFLGASSSHRFMAEFLEVGGILTMLEILGLKQAKEQHKTESLRVLALIASSGRKYKELICEGYGVRQVAECLAKSKSELTQEEATNLLLALAQGNPKYVQQVYKGLIALLPASSPRAQQLAARSIVQVQPMVGEVNPTIVEPMLGLLQSYHLEVLFQAIELIKQSVLEFTSCRSMVLRGLVALLKPAKSDTTKRPSILDDPEVPELKKALPVFIQQAAAAKTIGILSRDNPDVAEEFIQFRVIHHLLFSMSNSDHADTQRQASLTLEHFCRTMPFVDETVRDAMGEVLYQKFMSNPESLYVTMDAVQCDVLFSNKVNIPGIAETAY